MVIDLNGIESFCLKSIILKLRNSSHLLKVYLNNANRLMKIKTYEQRFKKQCLNIILATIICCNFTYGLVKHLYSIRYLDKAYLGSDLQSHVFMA